MAKKEQDKAMTMRVEHCPELYHDTRNNWIVFFNRKNGTAVTYDLAGNHGLVNYGKYPEGMLDLPHVHRLPKGAQLVFEQE